MSKEAKDVARRLIEAHGAGDVATVREFLSHKLIWHMAGAPGPMSRDDYAHGVDEGMRAFSHLVIKIEDLIAEGDRVAARLTLQALHTGTFMNVAATGRSIKFVSFWIYRIAAGKIVEAWSVDEDFLEQLR